jgi:hypothetical protein
MQGHSIGNSKEKSICTCVLFRTVPEIDPLHCIDEQHAMSSYEMQSALMLTVEFSKCIILSKLSMSGGCLWFYMGVKLGQ